MTEGPDIPLQIEGDPAATATPATAGPIAAAFARVGAQVLEQELGGQVTWEATAAGPMSDDLGVKALVGLAGSFRGSVTYAMDRDTAKVIYGRMSGTTPAALDELAHSAIGELANMISGRGTTVLEQQGYTCDITPPVLIIGEGARINTVANRHEYARIDTDAGRIMIDTGIDA